MICKQRIRLLITTASFSITTAFIPFANLVHAEQLIRGPYLQQGDSDSVIVRWRSDVATDSRVEFGTSASDLNQSIDDQTVTTEHEVEVTGLQPATRYYYSIGDTQGVLSVGNDHYFETSPQAGDASSTRIWVIGDSGTANSNAQAVYNAYRNYAGTHYTHLWLMLGDNAYNDGTDAEYQDAVFDMYPELLRQTPLWSTLGNHDGHAADSASQTGPYYEIFSLPRNAEVGGVASGTEAYYSFNYGNIHFVVLDSYESNRDVTGPMMSWLQSDLQANTSDWLVAFWHHPPYTKGSHNSDSESQLIQMRERFLPVLESYGVDLVLSGHSHSYERSKLIDGHYGSSGSYSNASHAVDSGSGRLDETGAYSKSGTQGNLGAVYAVAGASGKISGGSLNHPAMFVSLNQLGSMIIDVNGSQMDVKYLTSAGTITDYFTITKSTTPPTIPDAPSNLVASVQSSTAIELTWQDNSDNETGFDIERSLDGANWSAIAAVGLNVTTYQDTGLSGSTTYHYRVRSKNSAGASGFSNVTNATTDEPTPIATLELQDGLNGFVGSQDTYVASGAIDSNWGSDADVNADGSDGSNGELIALFRWDLSQVPATANVTQASVEFDVFNPSNGGYNLAVMEADWSETSATWRNTDVTLNQGTTVASLFPSSAGSYTLALNNAGIAALQAWVDGSSLNAGFMLRSTGTSDGVDIRAREYNAAAARPKLILTYETGVPVTLPSAPTNLAAQSQGASIIQLTWQDTATNEAGFRIERKVGGQWQNVATVAANAISYTDSGLNTNTEYKYRVLSYNSAGDSSWSNIVVGTTDAINNPVTITLRDGESGYLGTQDAWLLSGNSGSNQGTSNKLEADGSDGSNGELVSLLAWDLSSIPHGAQITQVSLVLRVSNVSPGAYGVYLMENGWSESDVTWESAAPDTHQGAEVGSFVPESTGFYTVDLNASAVSRVQSWVDGAENTGFMIRSLGTNNGVIVRSSEYGSVSQRPAIIIVYQ